MMSEQQELIPCSCIPDEIATECVVRIPHRFHSTLKLVSHGWRSLLSRPSFYSQRLLLGSADHLLFLVHPASYSLGVFNLTRGEWHRLAMSPGVRIPLFTQVVSLPTSGKLLLLGGWDPDTLQPVSHVYVIDLLSGTWRRGSPMSAPRSFFAVVVAAGIVYVAGGHDGQKNALRSAEVYDVEADVWAALPNMEEERDECLGMPAGGMGMGFLVVSGYATVSQGRFREDAEWFDPREGRWSKVDGVLWPYSSTSPRTTCVGGGVRGRWWWLAADGEVNQFYWTEMRWKSGRKIPMPLGFSGSGSSSSTLCVVDLGVDGDGPFMVMMGENADGVFLVDSEGKVWKRVETPPHFSGLPFSTSHLLI